MCRLVGCRSDLLPVKSTQKHETIGGSVTRATAAATSSSNKILLTRRKKNKHSQTHRLCIFKRLCIFGPKTLYKFVFIIIIIIATISTVAHIKRRISRTAFWFDDTDTQTCRKQ